MKKKLEHRWEKAWGKWAGGGVEKVWEAVLKVEEEICGTRRIRELMRRKWIMVE